MEKKQKILSVENLVINFKTDSGILKAVRNVSFDLYKGETLCIVGESGSGKSVTSKAIMGILANNAIVDGGRIMYRGENLLEIAEEQFYKIRGHKIGMIFQDPLSSLNPIVKIGKQITEATLINSNKLKTMFDDLISNDLIAYKNNQAKANIALKLIDDKIEQFIVLNKKKMDKREFACKLKVMKQEAKNSKKKIIEKYKVSEKPLKIKLKDSKKQAKKQVRDYKVSVLKERKEKLAALRASLVLTTDLKEKAKLKKEISDAKDLYTSKFRITRVKAKETALNIMREVGIPEPEKRFKQYPFEFSGGMRQRIVIAIALTVSPEILICDEPTTALDVTIQAQILELIKKIQKERNLSCIFITHDLGVVANMADRVAVMYAGKIVEYGTAEEIYFDPKHPYTWALLSSIPDINSKEKLDSIPGTPPNMIYPPKGDAFAARNKYAMNIDFEEEPPLFKISDTHYAATWLLSPDAPKVEMPKIVKERIANSLKARKVEK